MDYVIRRRNKGVIKPLKINCNRGGLTMLEDEEPLSPSSAAFHTPGFNVHVLAIMGIKISINVDVFKAKFPTAFLNHPHFSSVVGVLLNFQSYSNKMILVLAVDEHAVPDPHQMCDDIVESRKLIEDAVISQGLATDSSSNGS